MTPYQSNMWISGFVYGFIVGAMAVSLLWLLFDAPQ